MNTQPGVPQSTLIKAVGIRVAPILIFGVAAIYLFFSLSFGIALTLVVMAALGSALIIWGIRANGDRRALERMLRSEYPGEGQWAAVCGKVVSLETHGEDSFDKVLAFRYWVIDEYARDLKHQERMGEKRLTRSYDGFYLAPTGIDSSLGIIRLRGFPDLTALEKSSLPNGVHTRAEEKSTLNPPYVPWYVARALIMARPVDRFEEYIRYRDEEEKSEGTCTSWVLRPDMNVCVFGKWNHSELLPSALRPGGLPVYAGSTAEISERLGDDGRYMSIGGIVLLLVATGIGIWAGSQ